MSNAKAKKPAPLPDYPEEEYNRAWPLEKNYKFIRKTNDPRFGEVVIVKNHSSGEVLFIKEKLASSKKEATADIQQLKSRQNLNHRNMLEMVGYTTEIKKQLCSTNYLSRGFYRYPQADMKRELLNHKKNLTEFSSQELNKMVSDELQALNHLHSKGLHHGDVRPLLIGQDKNTNTFTLLDRFNDPAPLEKAQINNIIGKRDLYMSPELYLKLKGKKKDVTYDAQNNDYHALGLSALALGTQDSIQDIYRPDGQFDQDKLNHHLNTFKNKYSHDPQLCNTVENLVRNGNHGSQAFTSNVHTPVQANKTPVQVNSTPNQDYFNPPQEREVNSTPQNFYNKNNNQDDDDDYNPYMQTFQQKEVPHKVQSIPQTTYVHANPTNTYVNAQPIHQNNTYVRNDQPITYVQNNPQQTYTETYVNSQPQHKYKETYVNSQPQYTYTESYVNTTPTYVQNTPQTNTYVQSTPHTQTNSNVTTKVYSSWEEYKKANPDANIIDEGNGNYTVQQDSQTQVQTTYSETKQSTPINTTNETNVKTKTIHHPYQGQTKTYVQSTPYQGETYVQSTPYQGETYVQSSPQQVKTSYVQNQPTYTYKTSYSNQEHVTQTVNTESYVNHGQKVEVRRGSYVPPDEQEMSKVHEVKKKYIMKEDGTVVLVDEEENEIDNQ